MLINASRVFQGVFMPRLRSSPSLGLSRASPLHVSRRAFRRNRKRQALLGGRQGRSSKSV